MSSPFLLLIFFHFRAFSIDKTLHNDPISADSGRFIVFEVPLSRAQDKLSSLEGLQIGVFRIFLDLRSRTT